MPGELHEFLTDHGVEDELLNKAKSHGISATGILSLIVRFGPEVIEIVKDILNMLQSPTVPPTPPPTATA